MQINPSKPKLKPPEPKRLKPNYDEPLSNFAFKFNMRRHIKGGALGLAVGPSKVGRCKLTLSNPG